MGHVEGPRGGGVGSRLWERVVVVLEVVSGNLTVSTAARAYGMSRQHIHRLLKRYHDGGLEAVDPRSRRPASNPRATSDAVIIAIVTLREQLSADGLDAGPLTLQWHLNQRGPAVPSTSTIRRILHHHGLITPQPALAIRLHPLAAGRRHRRRDPVLARRPLPLPAQLHRVSPGQRRRRRIQLHRHHRHPWPTRIHPDRQRIGLHLTIHPRTQRLWSAWESPKRTDAPATPKPKARSSASTEPSNCGSANAGVPRPSPSYKPCSTASPGSTTPSARTAPTTPAPHHNRPTKPCPKPRPPAPPNTSASATTPSTNSASSPCGTAAGCTTSASAANTAAPRSHPRGRPNRHRHQQNRPPRHRQPPHRPRPQLLAQPTKKPGQKPGFSVTGDSTHL